MSSAPAGNPGFDDLGLGSDLLTALTDLGYEEPTPIQLAAIPLLLAGRDLVGRAATGTGKTAAFALPSLQRWSESRHSGRGSGPTVIVLVPTRELAMQVSEAFHRYGRGLGARVVPIYGGQPIGRQLHALSRGVDVVVATPGRAMDHLNRGTLRLQDVETVVLDEADEMLDMGFVEEIDALLDQMPPKHQTVLLSATMPARIDRLAQRHLDDPERVDVTGRVGDSQTASLVDQVLYVVPRSHKAAALGRLLDVEAPDATLIFCRTRTEVDQLTETMNGRGYRAEALHGGMNQEQRERVMARLRAGTAELIVATDVAARGLDIDVLTHVVNYDVPSAPESYVHRVGRVGRAGRRGVAVTLAEPREHRLIQNIEAALGSRLRIAKVPSVADLQARRLDLTREAVRERLLNEDCDEVRVVVESLTDEFDVVDVALAAIQLLHDRAVTGAGDAETEIPEVGLRANRRDRQPVAERRDRKSVAERRARNAPPAPGKARLFINVGRAGGVRPGDLVGAIAGESGLRGRDIGPIDIAERFSLVDVPANRADQVIDSMRGALIRGKRASVRRDRA
ncbi:MAG: DEAD/DEAH box helicase [Microthrixaceae bacterium]|nr:DEAD/DEAH box helicase [Microthrixaceae bacterium]